MLSISLVSISIVSISLVSISIVSISLVSMSIVSILVSREALPTTLCQMSIKLVSMYMIVCIVLAWPCYVHACSVI